MGAVPTTFRAAMRQLARLPDPCLDADWQWRPEGQVLDARSALYRSLEDEQAAASREPQPSTEGERMSSLADAAEGDLIGLLVGLDDALLDASPGEGQWPVRDILGHILATERRYIRQIEYALSRTDAQPVYTSIDLEHMATDRHGDLTALLDRLSAARDVSRQLFNVTEVQLERPTEWAGYRLHVRDRLHRFAAHLVEHTIHAEKALDALDYRPTEAARIVRRICRQRATHAARTSPEALSALDHTHTQRAAVLQASA